MNFLKTNNMPIMHVLCYNGPHSEAIRSVEQTDTLPIPGEYLQLNTDSGQREQVDIRRTAPLQPQSGRKQPPLPLDQS